MSTLYDIIDTSTKIIPEECTIVKHILRGGSYFKKRNRRKRKKAKTKAKAEAAVEAVKDVLKETELNISPSIDKKPDIEPEKIIAVERYHKEAVLPAAAPVHPSQFTHAVSIETVNYAPPGYLCWNYYYSHPLQEIPNDTEIIIRSAEEAGVRGIVIGFIYNSGKTPVYKIITDLDAVTKTYSMEELEIENSELKSGYKALFKQNSSYHKKNPPTHTLSKLDYLIYTATPSITLDSVSTREDIVGDKKKKDIISVEEKSSTMELVEKKNIIHVIMAIQKAKNSFDKGFDYCRWKLYVLNDKGTSLEYFDSIVVDKQTNIQYNSPYVSFCWGKNIFGKPSFIPLDNVTPSDTMIPHKKIQALYLKTTTLIPASMLQIGGGEIEEDATIHEEIIESVEPIEIPPILDMYRVKGSRTKYRYKLAEVYSPYPTRSSYAPTELLIEKNYVIHPDYELLLGVYEFTNRENFFGFIYKHEDREFYIIKKAQQFPIETHPLDILSIIEDGAGDIITNQYCYWFLCKKLMDSENQYQILLYADTTENRTNSVPLGTTWYPIDTASLHDKVGVKKIPIQVSVHIDDIGCIHEYIMANTFLMLPFEIPDYETEIYIVQGSNVRIIKDKAHDDCNIRYFTGVVKSVQNNAIDSKKVYTVELDHFTKNKRIEVTDTYLELLDNKNSLQTFFTYIKTNKKQLSKQKYEKSKQYRMILFYIIYD